MHPAAAASTATIPVLVVALLLPKEVYQSHWRTPKYFDLYEFALGSTLLAAFVVGAIVAGRREKPICQIVATPRQTALLQRGLRVTLTLTMLGYVAWGAIAAARGLSSAALANVLAGTPNALSYEKSQFLAPVAGITTLTQFAPVAVVCALVLRALDRSRRVWTTLVPLLAFAMLRTIFYAERLALLEIIIPFVICALAFSREHRPTPRWVRFLPIWAPLALIVVFGVFEYNRSWSTYYKGVSQRSFASFTVDRLEGYYATAANNSALLLKTQRAHVPAYSLNWLWNAPIIGERARAAIINDSSSDNAWRDVLVNKANPEFNNQGGLLLPVAEFGTLGATIFWCALGLIFGATYRRFREGALEALLLFPILFLGLLELPRIYYWPQGRAVPALFGCLVLAAAVRRHRRFSLSTVTAPAV